MPDALRPTELQCYWHYRTVRATAHACLWTRNAFSTAGSPEACHQAMPIERLNLQSTIYSLPNVS